VATTAYRELRGDERRLLVVLGLPALALALALTTVTTYLPVVAREFAGSQLLIGLVIALQGLMALWVPVAVGAWSDRAHTRWGGRLPFTAAATPVAVTALVLMAVVPSLGLLALVAGVFFIAYFTAYEPYRALYPDVLDDDIAGRAQSAQALARGVGTGLALVGGGLLISLATAAPFVAAAAVVLVTLAGFVALMRGRTGERPAQDEMHSVRAEAARLWRLARDHAPLRLVLIANALFELAIGAMGTFLFLYLTEGLGLSKPEAAAAVGVAAVFVLLGAGLSGRIADRYGRTRVLLLILPFYALGLFVPLVFSEPWVVAAAAPFAAFGGGTIMALPYALLMPLMPEEDRGAVTGLYTLSRGVGTALGPLLAGGAITLAGPLFDATKGYQPMWLVCALAIAASIPVLRRLRRDQGQE
jgi:MFS family permease